MCRDWIFECWRSRFKWNSLLKAASLWWWLCCHKYNYCWAKNINMVNQKELIYMIKNEVNVAITSSSWWIDSGQLNHWKGDITGICETQYSSISAVQLCAQSQSILTMTNCFMMSFYDFQTFCTFFCVIQILIYLFFKRVLLGELYH